MTRPLTSHLRLYHSVFFFTQLKCNEAMEEMFLTTEELGKCATDLQTCPPPVLSRYGEFNAAVKVRPENRKPRRNPPLTRVVRNRIKTPLF